MKKQSFKILLYKILERRPGDLAMSYFNPEKAKKVLGFEAEIDVEESVRNMLMFYRN